MRTLSGWVIAIWSVAFLLLILDLAVSTYNIDALIANDFATSRSREISRSLADLLSDMKDAETGQRGYQITGRDEYLEPYRRAESNIPARLSRLREITAADEFYADRLDEIASVIEAKLVELRTVIGIRKQDREAARDEIAKGVGKTLMDTIRTRIGAMEQHEEAILAARSAAARSRYDSSRFTSIFGGALTILMVAMAFAVIRREFARRLRAEDEARQAADDLAGSQKESVDTLALLDAFLSNAPIGMAFFDSELRYLRINEHLAAANGKPVAEHLGKTIAEAVPNMPPMIPADLREVSETRRPLLNREVTGRPGQPERTWLSSYFPVRTSDGRSLGVGVVALDITERLAALQRLRESEARKGAILETALDCVISIDHTGAVMEFNPAAERTFGYSRAEILGHDMATLIVPPVHRAGCRAGLRRYIDTGTGTILNRRIELPAIRKDGTEFPTEVAITAIHLGAQPVFTAYLRDITERKRAELALRASEARSRTLTEAIPQLVWSADAAGRVTYFNRRWVEYTGLAAADATESWWSQVAHPDDAARLEAGWRTATAGGPEPFEFEVRIREAADESYHWFATALVPLTRADGTIEQWIGSLSSIDDQKRQSELLATLVKMRTTELESANHLLRDEIAERTRAESRAQATAIELGRSNEELEKFAYVASHDLQEPLRKIQAFGDRLAKKYREALGVDGQEMVDRMKAAATRMRTLIDDLLTFSRVTSKGQAFAAIDLGSIVHDVLADLELRISQSNGSITVGDLPVVEADPLQMRQLFQNLIANALKFQKPNVPPVVAVHAVPWEALPADAEPVSPVGQGYRITVTDNGIGFEPQYAERIFELFQRLHGRGEYDGTGIGLAICRKILLRHGGTIVARSQPGVGTSFVIDLPRTPEQSFSTTDT
jgi:PAS domain S-box-containing protein